MHAHFRPKNYLLLLVLAAALPATSHAAGAARIEFASGNVLALTPAGAQRTLVRGAELAPGEVIRTGDNARAQLRFSDGGMMSLQPQTEFRIDEYSYNGRADGSEKGFFSLIKGGLRTITGIIGRGKRDNYKVTTSVATIGIRGTEYSAVFSGGTEGILNLATGEGAVEICNAGGCVIVASGESAVVTGTTPPTFTPLRPSLPPAALGIPATAAEPYMPTETRSGGGTLALLGPDLSSGTDYAISWTYKEVGGPDARYPATAVFGPGSKLENFNDGSVTYTSSVIAGAFSVDGVIGWGSWSSGYNDSDGILPMTNVHYVVGKPTSAADLDNLSGTVASYALQGYTTPTSSNGTGSSVTGSLTANFAGSATTIDANIGMKVGADSVNAVATGMTISSGALFNSSGGGDVKVNGVTDSSGSVSMQGFFAGANASHAGLSYKISTQYAPGTIQGAAAFKRTP